MSKQKLIVILGPTASGKSELAIKLALRLGSRQRRGSPQVAGQAKKKFGINGAEIISADSRQIYRGMDIATAKPSRSKKLKVKSQKYLVNGIPHHLIDVVYPNQEFNVAIYKKLGLKVIKDIQKRGKLPFLVGGTGLYIQTIVDNIEFPKVPPQKKLREKLEKKSAKELFEIYQKLDPEGTKFIEKENPRRLIRAIEVCKVTGTSFWKQRQRGSPLFNVLQIGIKSAREKLQERIIERVQKMFKLGLEKEVKNLIKKYGWIPPLQTIGYQEWKEYFEGKINKNDVKNLIIKHTNQFARRQMTWFKKDKRIKWVKIHRQAERLLKEFLE